MGGEEGRREVIRIPSLSTMGSEDEGIFPSVSAIICRVFDAHSLKPLDRRQAFRLAMFAYM